ncbi:Sodium/myo-inositol cotransporter [Hypsibius exemplaris]|uniref:Sodium/myo-inositol cotransporter n=1 Tax=Hypsibius exemplaris TaxID=2072580 RepID=A0A9X6RL67_HYPEX|nr:Sodium/myo-inositol cotransporter [Hypsibius exemplaris]
MSLSSHSKLDNFDIAGIVIYFIVVVGVGLLSMCTAKRNTVSGYFLANKETKWYIVGASLFASNIGTEHFVGLAGSGAAVGISVGAFEISGLVALQLLGWVFLPVYIASKAYTLPEYIKKRFGGSRIRVYLAMMSLTLYIFTKISVALYSGILFVNEGLEWNKWFAIMLLLGMTAVSSFSGGLTAAIYTEVLQAVSILIGAAQYSSSVSITFLRIGGYQKLVELYPSAKANYTHTVTGVGCNEPLPDAFVMLREVDDPNLPGWHFYGPDCRLGLVLGSRPDDGATSPLREKSVACTGRRLAAGYFKFTFLFVMILPGMIGRVLWKDEVACANPDVCEEVCGNRRGCTDIVYPKLVMELLPSGLRGLMLAVMLSSLVSDLLSIFNSASALFTIDIWSKIRKNAQAREILIVGRLFNVILLVISVLWVPLIQQVQGGQLFFYLKAVAAYLSPPIGATFILAMFWKRCNEPGAFYGLMVGLVAGITRMVLDFVYRPPECGMPDDRPHITKDVHYLYFAFILFCLTVAVAVVVSLLTQAPSPNKLIRTTFATRFDETVRPDDFRYDRRRSRLLSLSGWKPTTALEVEIAMSEVNHVPTEERTGSPDVFTELQLQGSLSHGLATAGGVVIVGDAPVVVGPPKEKEQCAWSNLAQHARRIFDCFCGFNQLTVEEKDAHDAHLLKVSSLEQNPRVKLFLDLNLGLLLALVVFVFIFFSTSLHDMVVLP